MELQMYLVKVWARAKKGKKRRREEESIDFLRKQELENILT